MSELHIECEHRSFEDTLAACEARGGVDLIVTSPPYPGARPGQYRGDAPFDWTWSDYQRLGDCVSRALRPGGFCAINIDGPIRERRKGIGSERDIIAFRLAIDWAERVGLRYVEHCAYVREGVPGSFGDRWRSGWEPVHVFQRPGGHGVFDRLGTSRPAIQVGRTYRRGAGRGRSDRRGDCIKKQTTSKRKQLTTAIGGGTIDRHAIDAEHPATFSLELADAFVLCYCEPGGVVCDPFVGSGTTAISCARHGRGFIGGDLGARSSDDRRWADIARERAIAERDRPRQVVLALE